MISYVFFIFSWKSDFAYEIFFVDMLTEDSKMPLDIFWTIDSM